MIRSLFHAPRAYPAQYLPYYDRLMTFYGSREDWLEATRDVPPKAVHLFALHWLHLEVFNGGFWQYFFNSTGVMAPEAAEGYARIGMHNVAAIVRAAMEQVGDPYPLDRETRRARVGEPTVRMDFHELNSAYYDLADTDKIFRRKPRFVDFADAYAAAG